MNIERRKSPRRAVRQPAIIINGDGSILGPCMMLDVSATGARLRPKLLEAVPHEFVLVLSRDGGLRRQCTVAWRAGTTMGVRFITS